MSATQLSRLWSIGKSQWLVMIAGALIYGALWALERQLTLPNLLFISIRPSVAAPLVCGLLWGPVVGFVVGALGLLLGDFVVPGPEFPIYWDVGAGLLGLVAGLSALVIRDFRSWREYVAAEVWALVAIYVSLDYVTIRQATYEGPIQDPWNAIFMPAFISNSVNALILAPILIWVLQKIKRR